MGFFLGTQEWVWNSRGKRAISVLATDGQLYLRNSSMYYFAMIVFGGRKVKSKTFETLEFLKMKHLQCFLKTMHTDWKVLVMLNTPIKSTMKLGEKSLKPWHWLSSHIYLKIKLWAWFSFFYDLWSGLRQMRMRNLNIKTEKFEQIVLVQIPLS